MTKFECTIHEAATSVSVAVLKMRPADTPESLKLEERMFIRRYRTRMPAYIKELLMKKQFSFCPNAIMGRAFTAGGEYRIRFEFGYEELRHTTFQTFLKRVTRWRIIATEINVYFNPAEKKTTLQVTMRVLKPVGVPLPVAIEQPEV